MASVTLGAIAPADAADDTGDGFVDDGVPTVDVTASRRVVSTGTPGTDPNGCVWSLYAGDDLATPIYENGVDLIDDSSPSKSPGPIPTRLFSVTGRWWQALGCTEDPSTLTQLSGVYAEGGAISMAELAGRARNQVDPPGPTSFGTSPPDNGTDRFPVVRIPTWFWVEDAYWTQEWTATAGYPVGAPRITATAFATPDRTEWNPGDGAGWVSCIGQGLIWEPSMEEDDKECFHEYTRSSAGRNDNAYVAQARVVFGVRWTTDVPGVAGGDLADIERLSAPQQLRVGEIQAVNR